MPSGWQKKGKTVALPTSRSGAINVFGLINRANDLRAFCFEGSIHSGVAIACIDQFAKTLRGRTVVVIDNASIHRSKKFTERIAHWKQMGLGLFYLPKYSPHLNIIETLWRKMKYEWLDKAAYVSKESLTKAVDNILSKVGIDYVIEFKNSQGSLA